jgi:SAM-dependent methyltransferase
MASLTSVLDTLREQRWLRQHLHILPTDFVLDVGSGGNPNLRSNVLCDKFLVDGTERHGAPIVVDRPFVAGDIQALPFKDSTFDYVILSHVLEHLPDPVRAMRELQRIARRGYIETPSAEFELITGFPFHRWLVSTDSEGLVLHAKSSGICHPELRLWFDRMHARLGTWRRFWALGRKLGVYTTYEWRDVINLRLEGNPASPGEVWGLTEAHHLEPTAAPIRGPRDGGPLWRLQQYASRRIRRQSDRPWAAIERALCSPCCRADLRRLDRETFECQACASKYPVHSSGIPLLLPECRQRPQVAVAANV